MPYTIAIPHWPSWLTAGGVKNMCLYTSFELSQSITINWLSTGPGKHFKFFTNYESLCFEFSQFFYTEYRGKYDGTAAQLLIITIFQISNFSRFHCNANNRQYYWYQHLVCLIHVSIYKVPYHSQQY